MANSPSFGKDYFSQINQIVHMCTISRPLHALSSQGAGARSGSEIKAMREARLGRADLLADYRQRSQRTQTRMGWDKGLS